jgi:hypothetical protein
MDAAELPAFSPFFLFLDTNSFLKVTDISPDTAVETLRKQLDAALDACQAIGKAASLQPAHVQQIRQRLRVVRRKELAPAQTAAPASPAPSPAVKGKPAPAAPAPVPSPKNKAVTPAEMVAALDRLLADDKTEWLKRKSDYAAKTASDALKTSAALSAAEVVEPAPAPEPKSSSPPASPGRAAPAATSKASPAAASRAKSPAKTVARTPTPVPNASDAVEVEYKLPVDGGFQADSAEAAAYRAIFAALEKAPSKNVASHIYVITDMLASIEELSLLLQPGSRTCGHETPHASFPANIRIDGVVSLVQQPQNRPTSASTTLPRPGSSASLLSGRGSKASSVVQKMPAKTEKADKSQEQLEHAKLVYDGPQGAALIRKVQESIHFPAECIHYSTLAAAVPFSAAMTPTGCVHASAVRDIAVVDLIVPASQEASVANTVVASLADSLVSCALDLHQHTSEYEKWLGSVSNVGIATEAAAPTATLQHYNELLDDIPSAMTDVSAVLFALVDSVVAVDAAAHTPALPDTFSFISPIFPVGEHIVVPSSTASTQQHSEMDHLLPASSTQTAEVNTGKWITIKDAVSLYAARYNHSWLWWEEQLAKLSANSVQAADDSTRAIQTAPQQHLFAQYCSNAFVDTLHTGLMCGPAQSLEWVLSGIALGGKAEAENRTCDSCLNNSAGLPLLIAQRMMHSSLLPKHFQSALAAATTPTSDILAECIGRKSQIQQIQSLRLVPSSEAVGRPDAGLHPATQGVHNTQRLSFYSSIDSELRTRCELLRLAEETAQHADLLSVALEIRALYGRSASLADASEIVPWDFSEWDTFLELSSHVNDQQGNGTDFSHVDMVIDVMKTVMASASTFGSRVYVQYDHASDCEVAVIHEPASRRRVRRNDHAQPLNLLDAASVRPHFSRWLRDHESFRHVSSVYDTGVDILNDATSVSWTREAGLSCGVASSTRSHSMITYNIFPADSALVSVRVHDAKSSIRGQQSCLVQLDGNMFGYQAAAAGGHSFFACFDAANYGSTGFLSCSTLAGRSFMTISHGAAAATKPDKYGMCNLTLAAQTGLTVHLTSQNKFSQEYVPSSQAPKSWPPWLNEVSRHQVGSAGTVVRLLHLGTSDAASTPISHVLFPDGQTEWIIPTKYLANVHASYLVRCRDEAVEGKESKEDDHEHLLHARQLRVIIDRQGDAVAVLTTADGHDQRWSVKACTPVYSCLEDTGSQVFVRYDVCPVFDPTWTPPAQAAAIPKPIYRKSIDVLRSLQIQAMQKARHAAITRVLDGGLWSGAALDSGSAINDPLISDHVGRVAMLLAPDGSQQVVHADGTVIAYESSTKHVSVHKTGYAMWENDVHFDESATAHSGAYPPEFRATAVRLSSAISTGPRTRAVITMPDSTVLACDYDATITSRLNGRLRVHRPDGLTIIGLDDGAVTVRPFIPCKSRNTLPEKLIHAVPNADLLDGVESGDTARGLVPVHLPGSYEFLLPTSELIITDPEHNTFAIAKDGQLHVDLAGALGLQSSDDVIPLIEAPAYSAHVSQISPLMTVATSEPVLPKLLNRVAPMVFLLPGPRARVSSHEFAVAQLLLSRRQKAFLSHAELLQEQVGSYASAAAALHASVQPAELLLPLVSSTILAPASLSLQLRSQQPAAEEVEIADLRPYRRNLVLSEPPHAPGDCSSAGVGHLLAGAQDIFAVSTAAWIFTQRVKRNRITKADVFGKSARFSDTLGTVSELGATTAPNDQDATQVMGATTPAPTMLVSDRVFSAVAASLGINPADPDASALMTALYRRFSARVVARLPLLTAVPRAYLGSKLRSEGFTITLPCRIARQLSHSAWHHLCKQAEASNTAWVLEEQRKRVHFECVDHRDQSAIDQENNIASRIVAMRSTLGEEHSSSPRASTPSTVEAARKAIAQAKSVQAARNQAKLSLQRCFMRRGVYEPVGTQDLASTLKAVIPALEGTAIALPAIPVNGEYMSTELVTTLKPTDATPMGSPGVSRPDVLDEARNFAPPSPSPASPLEMSDAVDPGKTHAQIIPAVDRAAMREERSKKAALRQLAEALEHARTHGGELPPSRGSNLTTPPAEPQSLPPLEPTDGQAELTFEDQTTSTGGQDIISSMEVAPDLEERSPVVEIPPARPLTARSTSPKSASPRAASAHASHPSQSMAISSASHGIAFEEPARFEDEGPRGPLQISPPVVDFGRVAVGEIVRVGVHLTNITHTLLRFRFGRGNSVHKPKGNSVRAICDLGPLAGHLVRVMELELLAREAGLYSETITVVAATTSYTMQIFARIQ